MGLLYEKDRRAPKGAQDKVMPDIKEAEPLRQVPPITVPLHDEDEDGAWGEVDGVLDEGAITDQLDAEDVDDE